MANLTLGLLGPLQVTLAGSPVNSFESDKARALLAYLAIRADRPHRRESLAGLFWPDLPEQSARQNLRQALYSVRRSTRAHPSDPPCLLFDRERVQFSWSSDYARGLSSIAARFRRVTSRQIGCYIHRTALGGAAGAPLSERRRPGQSATSD